MSTILWQNVLIGFGQMICLSDMEIFYNFKDLYHYINWYQGDLLLKRHFEVYDGDNLVAKMIKKQ